MLNLNPTKGKDCFFYMAYVSAHRINVVVKSKSEAIMTEIVEDVDKSVTADGSLSAGFGFTRVLLKYESCMLNRDTCAHPVEDCCEVRSMFPMPIIYKADEMAAIYTSDEIDGDMVKESSFYRIHHKKGMQLLC